MLLEKDVGKIFSWASRSFSKVQSQHWPEHPPFPIPFSTACFPPPERAAPAQSSQCLLQGAWCRTVCEPPGATIPTLLPEEQASQWEWDWRVALNSPYVQHSSTVPCSVSWWSGSSSKLLIDSTPGSFFLVIPAGRVWCIKELQRLKLERPVVFNHLVHPPTWAGDSLRSFFWCCV